VKKKKQKHLIQFRVVKPDVDNITETYFLRYPFKINYLRNDSLALFLLYSSIRPNSNILIFEDCGGLIVGAVAQKLQNDGKITLCNMKDNKRSVKDLKIFKELDLDKELNKSIECKSLEALINENPEKKYTHLLIVSEQLPLDILQYTITFLNGSANIVIFSPHLEPLGDCYEYLQNNKLGINIHIHEIFTREYQVLPLRTHPNMRMSGFSGYVMEATRILQ